MENHFGTIIGLLSLITIMFGIFKWTFYTKEEVNDKIEIISDHQNNLTLKMVEEIQHIKNSMTHDLEKKANKSDLERLESKLDLKADKEDVTKLEVKLEKLTDVIIELKTVIVYRAKHRDD